MTFPFFLRFFVVPSIDVFHRRCGFWFPFYLFLPWMFDNLFQGRSDLSLETPLKDQQCPCTTDIRTTVPLNDFPWATIWRIPSDGDDIWDWPYWRTARRTVIYPFVFWSTSSFSGDRRSVRNKEGVRNNSFGLYLGRPFPFHTGHLKSGS